MKTMKTIGLVVSVSMFLLLSPAPASAAISLTNGDFETTGAVYLTPWWGDALREATGWINLSSPSFLFQAASAPGLAMQVNDATRWLHLAYDGVGSEGKIYQELGTMVAGETYTFTADLLGIGWSTWDGALPDGPGGYKAYAAFKRDNTFETVADTTDSLPAPTPSDTVGAVKTGAFNLSYTATPADDGRLLFIYLEGLLPADATYGLGRGGIDNAAVTVTPVPEPATLSVLVLGGVAAILRRRRK